MTTRPRPPVPAGLQKPTRAMLAMADLFETSPDLLAAAAKQSPPAAGNA